MSLVGKIISALHERTPHTRRFTRPNEMCSRNTMIVTSYVKLTVCTILVIGPLSVRIERAVICGI